MSLDEYISQLKQTQKLLSEKEEFEVCAEITQLIEAIEKKDEKKFIELNFDVKTLTKAGFFKKKATLEEKEARVVQFFGLDTIYEYASRFGEGYLCKYYRYAHGIFDVKSKVEF